MLGPIKSGTVLKVVRQRVPHDVEVILEGIDPSTGELMIGKNQDLAIQLSQLREYATRRSAEVSEFTDHGVSGAKATRPGLDALMAAVRRRDPQD